MDFISNHTHQQPSFLNGISTTNLTQNPSLRLPFVRLNVKDPGAFSTAKVLEQEIIKPEALAEMIQGSIPNLQETCEELYNSLIQSANDSALQFIPILKKLNLENEETIERFIQNPKTSHVLVQNSSLKVVLIHWKAGVYGKAHGHRQGGCVFKVLKGSLQEKRFTPDTEQKFLGVSNLEKNSLAYIDDEMAYHAVGNVSNEPAISIHVYTTGA